MKLRINKYISLCNIAPRREVTEMLKNKEFIINGKIAEIGQMVDLEKDIVEHAGKVITPIQHFTYIKLNKPKNVLSTVTDDRDRDRTTVMELVNSRERLYPIGRLDFASTGLIILTNDGDLALKLTHPKYHLPKVYDVTVDKELTMKHLKLLETGIMLDSTQTLPTKVKKLDRNKFQITLYQGMKRQIREMCKAIDLNVLALNRIKIGNVSLGSLKPGEYTNLTQQEIESLLKS